MTYSSDNTADAASLFFDNYLICLNNAAIPVKQQRWYVKRVEAFIKAQNGHKIKSLTDGDVTQYFETIGRQSHLSGWQFRQCVNAIRILYCDHLACSTCQKVNWQYRLDSAKQLELDHPTTARVLTPEELSFAKERRGEGPFSVESVPVLRIRR